MTCSVVINYEFSAVWFARVFSENNYRLHGVTYQVIEMLSSLCHRTDWVKFKVPFNLLKPTGHVMRLQFNIQQLYVLPTLYLCVLYLSENKQRLVPFTVQKIGFYNRDEKCLLRGTNWVFK